MDTADRRRRVSWGLLILLLMVTILHFRASARSYDFAAPHKRGLDAWAKLDAVIDVVFAIPTVVACGGPPCDFTQAKPTAKCPDPITGPCTSYQCKDTTTQRRNVRGTSPRLRATFATALKTFHVRPYCESWGGQPCSY